MELEFLWWDDAVAQARALAQWTNLRHRVTRNDRGAWEVEPEPLASLLEVCS